MSLLSSLRPITSPFQRSFGTQVSKFIVQQAPVVSEKEPTATPIVYNSDVAAISGAPLKHANRPVTIYQPSRNVMQSGTHQTRYWKIQYGVQQRWENPMMGWTSSSDPCQALDLQLRFNSKDAAIYFAERQGLKYTVKETHQRRPTLKRTYASNFKYSSGKLRLQVSK
eukprot:Lithocolla_globosa_v1_NODE_8505_length_812_cov_10.668428.p1 type:complete len:168 gc:universal NODE_8505_length_812_cov_10.668428:566-63(-)